MSDRRNHDFPPSINCGRFYERVSSKGHTYLAGYFGSMRITLLRSKNTDAEGNVIWDMLVSASPPRDRAGNAVRSNTTRHVDDDADHSSGRARVPMAAGVTGAPVD